jgi:hypothetical protein
MARIHGFGFTAGTAAMSVQVNCGSTIHTPPTVQHLASQVKLMFLSEYILPEPPISDHRLKASFWPGTPVPGSFYPILHPRPNDMLTARLSFACVM